MSTYLVVLEEGPTSYGAYSPDVPGCFAVGSTTEEALQRFQEALQSHMELLREEGEEVPLPTAQSATVDILVPA
ncbi:MAG: type II toxin-antitoxin system HicB family antitoxin [Chloroflexota bacterium]|nr:type II toxin-antitoxin system HicB family antitoxin [Chloroflexota bacterium]